MPEVPTLLEEREPSNPFAANTQQVQSINSLNITSLTEDEEGVSAAPIQVKL